MLRKEAATNFERALPWDKGIPHQIIHRLTGLLVHSVEGCAFQIRYRLTHPDFASQIGAEGREHVKESLLMTTNVKRWLLPFRMLERAKSPPRSATPGFTITCLQTCRAVAPARTLRADHAR